jgi:predicted Rossmann fold nucleotide-binding protein DprA/Smf involved in DNA uptake
MKGGEVMRKPGKSVSFDGMVKFFLQYYKIPTRKDIEKLMNRIDSLEKLIKSKMVEAGSLRTRRRKPDGAVRENMTASDVVAEVIAEAGEEGISFSSIKEKTGYEDKKLRNIIFRLNKLGRIRRKARGVYMV